MTTLKKMITTIKADNLYHIHVQNDSYKNVSYKLVSKRQCTRKHEWEKQHQQSLKMEKKASTNNQGNAN